MKHLHFSDEAEIDPHNLNALEPIRDDPLFTVHRGTLLVCLDNLDFVSFFCFWQSFVVIEIDFSSWSLSILTRSHSFVFRLAGALWSYVDPVKHLPFSFIYSNILNFPGELLFKFE